MIRRIVVAAVLCVAAIAAHAQTPKPHAITGFWRTADGGAVIHITDDNGRFPAHIVWLKQSRYPADDPKGMAGQKIIDRHNPNPAKRDRTLVGLQLIKGLHYQTDDNQARWKNGRVYDPEHGKWHDCYVWLADPGHLKLHGYVGVSLFGHTTTWTRVADPDFTASISEASHEEKAQL